MSGRTLAAILLRVWGVVLIVGAIVSFADAFFFLMPQGGESVGGAWRASAVSLLLRVIISAIAGVYLVRNGDRVAAWLVSDIEDSGPAISSTAIEPIALRLLGVYFVVSGVAILTGEALMLGPSTWLQSVGKLAGGVVEFVAGILLIWRRDQIGAALARGWRVIRSRDAAED